MELAGKKVLIMGLGSFGGGVDAALYAVRAGAEVTVTDLWPRQKLAKSLARLENEPIEYRLGSHCRADFESADVVIANPAVAADNQYLQAARESQATVTSAMNIFIQRCPGRVIGITGANGKSTTTALTAHILEDASRFAPVSYKKVRLSGNIGNKPLLGILEDLEPEDVVVLEISSFQTEMLSQIEMSTHIALLTNLTPNHLDRHGTFEDYCSAKENLFRYQRPGRLGPCVSIFNKDDAVGRRWYELYNGQDGRLCRQFSHRELDPEMVRAFKLPGQANRENLAAAVSIARALDVPDAAIARTLAGFKGLAHRLEFIAQVDGVAYYNDSISTTPDSTIAALRAFEQPRIIIAGGYDKQLPFGELGKQIGAHAKAAVLVGQTKGKIAQAIWDHLDNCVPVVMVDSMAQAVEHAHQLASASDAVILSPACASYDMFDNFTHRAQVFVECVNTLRANPESQPQQNLSTE